LFTGRLLEGVSAGLIGVVVPLYLAECLPANARGKGTGIFQLLPVGLMLVAVLIGMYFSYRVQDVARSGNAMALFAYKDHVWRTLFWMAEPFGVLFLLGSLTLSESPRWLFRNGKKDKAYAAFLRACDAKQAAHELREMEAAGRLGAAPDALVGAKRESLLRRQYVVPFVLACVVLMCTQTTGINSIIAYNTSILLQSGLTDLQAHWGYVIFTGMNFLFRFVGMLFVDRRGRKFLLAVGTGGIILSIICVGLLFLRTEAISRDAGAEVQTMVTPDQQLHLHFNPTEAATLLAASKGTGEIDSGRSSLVVIYSYGDFTSATNFVRSDDPTAPTIQINRSSCVPANRIMALLKNPFGNLTAAKTAPLKIEMAALGPVPDTRHGWLVALGLFVYMASFAFGPGVCVWLALSELMPTRIRSNGMSIALVLNQIVATALAGIFLPFVSKHGYSSMFFLFAGFTVVYFAVAVFLLPETKGKTLEEIEAHFEGSAAR
jgi:MFS family permease